jgi:hypothetical protein
VSYVSKSNIGNSLKYPNDKISFFLSHRRGQRVRSFARDLSELTKGICMLPPRKECDYTYNYRIPDGSCNNPNPNILRGASLTAQARFLDPEYGDGMNIYLVFINL